MTIKDVQDILDAIQFQADHNDFEAAHHLEDTLYEDVLRTIVEGHQDPVLLAIYALKSQKIEFKRACS